MHQGAAEFSPAGTQQQPDEMQLFLSATPPGHCRRGPAGLQRGEGGEAKEEEEEEEVRKKSKENKKKCIDIVFDVVSLSSAFLRTFSLAEN